MTRRMVGGGDPFCLKCRVKLTQLERKCRFSIFTRKASAVTSSEKVQLTLITSSGVIRGKGGGGEGAPPRVTLFEGVTPEGKVVVGKFTENNGETRSDR